MSSLRPCKQERRNTKAERCTDFFLFVLLEIRVPFHLVCSQCLRFLLFVLYINFRNLQKSRPSVTLLSISNNYSAHPHKCQLTSFSCFILQSSSWRLNSFACFSRRFLERARSSSTFSIYRI